MHTTPSDPEAASRARARRHPHRPSSSAVRWSVAAALVVVAFVLGWIGYEEAARQTGVAMTPTTTLYHVLHLFEFSMSSVPDALPWQLDVARYLAVGLTVFAAASAAIAIAGGQLDQLRARLTSGHIIVVGLGALGVRAAMSLRAAGYRVVAVDDTSASSAAATCRKAGVIVLRGDPADPGSLRRAGVDRARYLLALTGDDEVNTKIAIDARRLLGDDTGRPLTCLVQLVDHSLVGLLERLGVSGSPDHRVRVEPLNVFDLAARAILDRFPPFDADGMTPLGPAAVLVVGLAGSGRELVVDVARRWYDLTTRPGGRLPIVLVDRFAPRAAAEFAQRSPGLDAACQVEAVEADRSSAGVAAAALLHGASGGRPPTSVYVCLGDDAASFNAALTIRHGLGSAAVPVIVQTIQEGGAAALLAGDPGHPLHQDFDIVATLDLISQPEVLLTGRNETLARAIHARYVDDQGRAGVTTASVAPWEELSAPVQESNRRQAADIGRKLAAVGCVIESLGDTVAPAPDFSPSEIETMASLEHERWMRDKLADGWRLAATRDEERKLTPYLVPYEDLPEAVKDIDRSFVRDIPARLASIGFTVRRLGVTGSAWTAGSPGEAASSGELAEGRLAGPV
jgi:hypothetical protein